MQKADQILQAIRKLGEKGLPLTRIYRALYCEELYLIAYNKIYRNHGALTPGTENDTVDGMSLQRIRNIIEELRWERFRFRPARRVRIPKKSGGSRPLGVPNFKDKLVQEVLRMILEAYYEPSFRTSSHGFRPGRGCHTALHDVNKFKGTTWFIEGDIHGCFDTIDHSVLMALLAKDIQDGRLLNLLRMSLDAGVVENWKYHRTYSGTPQGGILSPILSNIYLHELDIFIEDVLIPHYTQGENRASSNAYSALQQRINRARQRGDRQLAKRLVQERRQLPSKDTQDLHFRRLRYVRYADDFLLGFIGPKSEAEEIKATIGTFLRETLHLEMNSTKTLITHARTERAKFLGYAVSISHCDHKISHREGSLRRARAINGHVRLRIPHGLIEEHIKRYQKKGKVVHEPVLLRYSDAHIIDTYQKRFRGLAEYYKYAGDRRRLGGLQYVMRMALVKTLADKFKVSNGHIYRKYSGTQTVDGFTYRTLQVDVPTKRGHRTIYWGAIPLKVVKIGEQALNDERYVEPISDVRSELIHRLQKDTCELCGSRQNCEVHHVRKLADLNKPGRKQKPEWVKRMAALRRKTLIVCRQCHDDIHAGRPTPKSRENVLESRVQ